MKNTLTLMAILFCIETNFAQFKKDIDNELLTEMVLKKQLEVRDEIIHRSLLKSSRFSSDASKNTIVNISNILMKEKNKLVIEQSLFAQLARFSIAYSIASYLTTTDINIEILKITKGIRKGNQNLEVELDTLKKKSLKTAKDTLLNLQIKEINQKRKLFDSIMDYVYFSAIKNKKYDSLFSKIIPESERSTYFQYSKKDPFPEVDKLLEFLIESLITKESIVSKFNDFLTNLNKIDCSKKGFSSKNISASLQLIEAVDEIIKEQYNDSLSNVFRLESEQFFDVIKIINRNIIFYDDESNGKVIRKFKIDADAIILEYIDFFKININYLVPISNYKIGIKPCLDIGINHSYFFDKNNRFNVDNDTLSFKQMSWAGEKIGLKFVLIDHGYTRSQQPMDVYLYKNNYHRWTKQPNKPFTNSLYVNLYGSGILYNLVDTKTQKKFNFGLVGLGLGIEFFNGLHTSINYSLPLVSGFTNKVVNLENGFLSLSFDISLIDYMRALKDK